MIKKHPATKNRQPMSGIFLGTTIIFLLLSESASAIPAFARKYQANCALCHDNEPRLTLFGQQFKENGYQMPGSEDGADTAKHVFDGEQGPVTVDDISKIMAVRIRGDIQQPAFKQETTAMRAANVRKQWDIQVPKIINLFFAGTATKNLSFFMETEYNTQEGPDASVKFERSFLVFSNLGGTPGRANIKVGKFDPSGLFAFPTHRQQLNPIGPAADASTFPPTINRIPLLPLAFASKMFGLTRGPSYAGAANYAILPVEPLLYNAPTQTSLSVYGRPMGFGSGFMYQIGLAVNDKVSTSTDDRQNRYDSYLMGRYDWQLGSADMQTSAFYYRAPNAAIGTLNMGGTIKYAANPTDIKRWGIGARGQWGNWDVYGTYITDKIDQPIFSGMAAKSQWESTGKGASLEADWRWSSNWMLGLRYDWMAPGGLKQLPKGSKTPLNVDVAFLAPIIKYYPSPNIGLYARAHVNLKSNRKSPIGGDVNENPLTNLRSMIALGVDMAF